MENIDNLNVNFAVGVGAVFDTQTGNVKGSFVFTKNWLRMALQGYS